MSGDSEHEFGDAGDAGDAPTPDSAQIKAADELVFQPRPFRSWARAHEEEGTTSLWSRIRARVAALFRQRRGSGISEEAASAESSAMVAEKNSPAEPLPVTPPQDFEFPWTRREAAPPPAEDEGPIPGTNEYAAEFDEPAPVVETSFASVEEALPSAREPLASVPFAPGEVAPRLEPKPGLLARLFRLSGKSKPRSSLEIEIHEDRIAAAADALDAVGEQTFAEDQEEPVASTDAFASVEEALPDADTVGPSSRETIEVVQKDPATAASSAFFDDTLEVVRDTPETANPAAFFGDTLEVVRDTPETADPAAFFGDTLEVIPEKPDTSDSAAYFGDTLEPGHFDAEIEEDTDEYEVVSAPPPETTAVPSVDLDEATAQVSRKSLIQRLISWRAKAKEQADTLEGGATLVEGNPVFLFSKFRTFYNEIIRSKHQKTEFTAGFSTAIVTDYAADLSPDGAAEALCKNLAGMLDLQAAEAMWMGGESAERYPDAQYAMAALADEIFLHTEWEGQGAWHKNLLEVRLFRTHAADVELFRRIDKLLKDQPDSPVARDLARVYLFVIAAGFRGKYRPFGLTRALAEYRQRLYEYTHRGGDALMIYAPERRIFPEAVERTLQGAAVSRFTAAQRWAAILVFLVVGYTVVAHVAWSRVSADLKDVTDRIIAGSTTAAGNP